MAATVFALCIIGLLMLYSASTDYSLRMDKPPTYIFNKQLLWLAIGIIVAFVASRIDYHIWRKLALPAMILTIILLIVVLIRNEVRYNAARALVGGSGQPSELAKLVTIIYLSVWLYSKREYMHVIQLGLFPLAIILGVIGGLIFIQPDMSATLTIFVLGGLLFFLAGGELRQIILLLLVALVAGWVVVRFTNTGQNRFEYFLAGLKDPLKSSSHVLWSLEAIYKGKLFGVGIGNASTKLLGLPLAATDSIFAVIVEELGLFGILILIGLYGILLWRGLAISAKAPDLLGAVLAAGLSIWIVLEAAINMAQMVGLAPFAGNALPFISAGGSNLISTLCAIGIVMGISRQSGKKNPATNTSASGTGDTNQRRSYGASVNLRRRDRRRSVSRPGGPASYSR